MEGRRRKRERQTEERGRKKNEMKKIQRREPKMKNHQKKEPNVNLLPSFTFSFFCPLHPYTSSSSSPSSASTFREGSFYSLCIYIKNHTNLLPYPSSSLQCTNVFAFFFLVPYAYLWPPHSFSFLVPADSFLLNSFLRVLSSNLIRI